MYYNRFRQEINSFCVVQRLERQLAGELEQRVGQYLRHGQTSVFGHALMKSCSVAASRTMGIVVMAKLLPFSIPSYVRGIDQM